MTRIQSFEAKGMLRYNESLAFGRGIEAEVKVGNPEMLKVADAFEAYRLALQHYDNSVADFQKSMLTDEIQEVTARHDSLFDRILTLIRTTICHSDEQKQVAAIRLQPLADQYAERQNLGLKEQIEHTNDFIRKLLADIYQTDLELLDLTEWVIRLKMVNDQCAGLNRKRAEDHSERRLRGTVAARRSRFERAYDTLVERFNTLADTEGDASYEALFAWWNNYIEAYRKCIQDSQAV